MRTAITEKGNIVTLYCACDDLDFDNPPEGTFFYCVSSDTDKIKEGIICGGMCVECGYFPWRVGIEGKGVVDI